MKKYKYLIIAILFFISFEVAFDLWLEDASKTMQITALFMLVGISIIALFTIKNSSKKSVE